MGSPLGRLLANSIMCSIQEKLEERNELPSLYKRYVDDTFTIMPDLSKADVFLDKLNSCHENLNFTMEVAEHDTISFVGMNITKCENRLERHKTEVFTFHNDQPRLSPVIDSYRVFRGMRQASNYCSKPGLSCKFDQFFD